MEAWQRIAEWNEKVYAQDLFKQSGWLAEGGLVSEYNAWKYFSLIPVSFLKTPTGETDMDAFKAMSAFLMYHWDAGQMAGISLSNGLCGQYNAGFTLLRSYLELLLKGSYFQCLSQKEFREDPNIVLKSTDSVSILTTNMSSLISQEHVDDIDLEKDSMLVFEVLRGHWSQDLFHPEVRLIARQVDGWGMLEGLEGNPVEIIGELYGELSQNVHERVEYTDSGRAVEEGTEIFEWPAPILGQSLSEFLHDFHLAMEVGVISVLNQLARQISPAMLQEKSRQLLGSDGFDLANLRSSTKLLKRWIARGPG